MMVRIEDLQNPEMLLEVKKARFNLYEKRLLRIMAICISVLFVLITVEAVVNIIKCDDERLLNFSTPAQEIIILMTAVVGLFFALTIKYKRR